MTGVSLSSPSLGPNYFLYIFPDAHSSYTGLVEHQTFYSLSQVSAGAGLLGPVRLSDTEGVPQGRDAGLQIELGGLRQVRLLTKVVEVKQCGAALHLCLHQGRRSDLYPDKNNEQW